MSVELIRNQRDKNSEELYATPPNEKCSIQLLIQRDLYIQRWIKNY